ncbi:MAG TPA: hypothetical protein VGP62_05780 [Bryobacteraceae bacterium]|nr:hypothetical protein [Bryobacteraceae bacterium]
MNANAREFSDAPNQKRETRNGSINGSIIDKVSRRSRTSQPTPAVPTQAVAEPERPEPAWIRPAILALAAICLIGMFSTEVAGYDTWWHLKTGEYIVHYRALPVPDPFSYTTYLGKPAYPGEEQVRHFNLTHEWLAQVVLYGIYAAAGATGLVIFKALLLAALCSLTGLIAAQRSGSFYLGLAAAFATAVLAVEFASDRPALVSFLMVAIFVAIFELRWPFWILPPLALLWANCHGGFFLGFVVMGAYSVEAAILRFQKHPLENDLRIWKMSALAVAVSFLNPNGFHILDTLFRYRQSYLTSTLIEWRSPYLWGPPYSFDILLYAAAVVLLLSWRKVRVSDWLLFAAFAVASLTAYRNILLIGFLAPILIAAWFPRRFRAPRFLGLASIGLLLATLITGVARGNFFQFRAALWQYPTGAVDFLRAHAISKPMFNTYEYGGYLIWRLWPQQRTFVDGRALNESVYQDYRSILYNSSPTPNVLGAECRRLLDRYAVRVVVMNTFEYVTGAFYPLALALGNPSTADWQLVYEDPQSVIFLRDPPAGIPVLDKARISIDHMEAECALHIEHEPEYPLCARSLADLSLRAGDNQRAKRMLGLYLSNATQKDPSAEQALRRLMQQ